MNKFLSLLLTFGVAACASHPDKIQQQYVSDSQYSHYDCEQLALEESRISRRVSQLHGSLEEKATRDDVQMGVGLVLFWPALFLLEGGDGPEAQEYARLKGEHEAIQRVAVRAIIYLTERRAFSTLSLKERSHDRFVQPHLS